MIVDPKEVDRAKQSAQDVDLILKQLHRTVVNTMLAADRAGDEAMYARCRGLIRALDAAPRP